MKRIVVFPETSGLQRKLRNSLSPLAAALNHEWEIGECLATYWRPHFESNTYPYLPVHITRPKEIRKLFTVHLPERCYFAASLPCTHLAHCHLQVSHSQ